MSSLACASAAYYCHPHEHCRRCHACINPALDCLTGVFLLIHCYDACRAEVIGSNRTWMEHCKWILCLDAKPLLCKSVTPRKESVVEMWQTPQHLRYMFPEAYDPSRPYPHQQKFFDITSSAAEEGSSTACRTWCLGWVRQFIQIFTDKLNETDRTSVEIIHLKSLRWCTHCQSVNK